jgi:hypothetical protein
MALFDKDIVEESNLNRLHGAFPEDAVAKRPKVEAIARSLEGLGIQVCTFQAWIGEEVCRDALKSCDIIFGCTDDHSGRLLLNRFAYYYATPVIDLGLAIEVSQDKPPRILCADGRVTVLLPDLNHTCLLCRGIIALRSRVRTGCRGETPAWGGGGGDAPPPPQQHRNNPHTPISN